MLPAKIKHFIPKHRPYALLVLGLLVVASRFGSAAAQNVTQGYEGDSTLERGMIVMIKKDNPTAVEALTSDKIQEMHGVVVNANDAPVTLSSEGQTVFIADTGRYEVLVNDQNGAINTGDYVTISSLKGIGMKADQKQTVVLGKALSSFDGQNGIISTARTKTDNGQDKQIAIGRAIVDISIGHNPLERQEANVPEVLRKATEILADKPVSAARAYLSVVVFLATAAISVSILYAGIRSSMIAIGRNPLSRKTISRSLVQVILTSLIIFISGLFGVYLLLKL